jgi:hypothetical protein
MAEKPTILDFFYSLNAQLKGAVKLRPFELIVIRNAIFYKRDLFLLRP